MTNSTKNSLVNIQGNVIILDRIQRISRPVGSVYNNQIQYKFDIVYDDLSILTIDSDYAIRYFEEQNGDNTKIAFSLAKLDNGLMIDIFEELPDAKAYEDLKVVIFDSVKRMHEELVELYQKFNTAITAIQYTVIEEQDQDIISTIEEIKSSLEEDTKE